MSARDDIAAAIATEREPRLFRECVYCGDPSRGLACPPHRELLWNDPNHYEMRLRTTDGTFASNAAEGAST